MPSPMFSQVIKTVAPFVGEEKAVGALTRRIGSVSATPDDFNAEHYKSIMHQVISVMCLYVPEPDKQADLTAKLTKLVA
jgi:hypothetical protein